MLGVSGLRGIAGESFTQDVAARFARAFAAWLREDRAREAPVLIVARDGRAGGDVFHESIIAALTAAGADVIDIGIATTPTAGVAVDAARADGAMIVTASHNPQQWNGLKCLVRGRTPSSSSLAPQPCRAPAPDDARAIIARFHADASARSTRRGTVRRHPAAADIHVARVGSAIGAMPPPVPGRSMAHLAKGLTIALDSVEGSGGPPALMLLQALGADEVLRLGGSCSGIFSHTPEPIEANLTGLCEGVRACGAGVGFAQDPDADRLAVVDENGTYIGEEYTLVLAAMAVLEVHGEGSAPILCANLSTSRMIDDVAARHGARVIRTPVGEAHVADAIDVHQALIGGEGNGGVIWPRITLVRDSLSAMGLILHLMARRRAPLSSIIAEIPRYAIVKRKLELPDRDLAARAVRAVADHFAQSRPRESDSPRIDTQDGVRVDLSASRAWVHVRASNTEPIMRLIAEAPTEQAAEAVLHEVSHAIGVA